MEVTISGKKPETGARDIAPVPEPTLLLGAIARVVTGTNECRQMIIQQSQRNSAARTMRISEAMLV